MKNRTIRVQGKGSVSQAPDRIRIAFTVKDTNLDFAKAIEGSNERIDNIRAAAQKTGIDPKLLKTGHFDVSEATDYVNSRRVPIGFLATHVIQIELPIDKEILGKFLTAVIRSKSQPEVNLAFTVSNPEDLRQRVLTDAIGNAKRRAETIAAASGVNLGNIENIEYGYTEVRVSSADNSMVCCESALSDAAPDFEPDDVGAE
ncbi:MAG: SIMPL domain-containing protein, partial [Deltaproteobacteria bacterium]